MGKALKKIAKANARSAGKTVELTMTTREKMAFNAGRQTGLQEGKTIGIEESIKYFEEKLTTLSDIKGIGDQRFKEICAHLGFKEKESE